MTSDQAAPQAHDGGGLSRAVASLLFLAVAGSLVGGLYNMLLHPLARFPGPLLYRWSILPWAYHYARGSLVYAVHKLHCSDIYGVVAGRENAKYGRMYEALSFGGIIPETISAPQRRLHRLLKGLLSQCFCERAVRNNEAIMAKHIRLMTFQLRRHCGSGALVDVTRWLNWTTMDVMGDLALGKTFGCLERLRLTAYVRLMSAVPELAARTVVLSYLRLGLLLKAFKYVFASALLRDLAESKAMLEERMRSDEPRDDLIEPFIRAERDGKLGRDHVLGAATTMMAAGSETTGIALAGFFYLMAGHRSELARLTAEIRSAFATQDDIRLAAVEQLDYLSGCLREALRLLPPAAVGLPRVKAADGRTIAGCAVPPGTIVAAHGYAMSHARQNFHKPSEFHPERFLGDGAFADDLLEASQPFSTGPRACVGRKPAMADMRLIAAHVLWNFDIEATPAATRWMDGRIAYMVWTRKPLLLKLTPVVVGGAC